MIAYVDASVVLRLVLGQPGRVRQWRRVKTAIASLIIEVECLRTIDRMRIAEGLDDDDVADLREATHRMLDAFTLVEPNRLVLSRASRPVPTALGTLDAIHLATALLWRQETGLDLAMLTHDAALATAARAEGLAVLGVSPRA